MIEVVGGDWESKVVPIFWSYTYKRGLVDSTSRGINMSSGKSNIVMEDDVEEFKNYDIISKKNTYINRDIKAMRYHMITRLLPFLV